MKELIIFVVIVLSFSVAVSAQNEAFEGGSGDGFSSSDFISLDQITFTKGGSGDGFSQSYYASLDQIIFSKGGFADGFASVDFDSPNESLFSRGDIGDGFSMGKRMQKVWSGLIGSVWTVSSNWSDGIVPDTCDHVIIPAGATFYPKLDAGVTSVGSNTTFANYFCKSIWIQNGGELVQQANNYLENHGLILIDGLLEVRNANLKAVYNKPGGTIHIRTGGMLDFNTN